MSNASREHMGIITRKTHGVSGLSFQCTQALSIHRTCSPMLRTGAKVTLRFWSNGACSIEAIRKNLNWSFLRRLSPTTNKWIPVWTFSTYQNTQVSPVFSPTLSREGLWARLCGASLEDVATANLELTFHVFSLFPTTHFNFELPRKTDHNWRSRLWWTYSKYRHIANGSRLLLHVIC